MTPHMGANTREITAATWTPAHAFGGGSKNACAKARAMATDEPPMNRSALNSIIMRWLIARWYWPLKAAGAVLLIYAAGEALMYAEWLYDWYPRQFWSAFVLTIYAAVMGALWARRGRWLSGDRAHG